MGMRSYVCIGGCVAVLGAGCGAFWYVHRQTPEKKPSVAETITLLFLGDIMLGRTVNKYMEQYGFEYPLRGIYAYTHAADVVIGNLETTFTRSTRAIPKAFNFKADPAHAKALRTARIFLVNIANNHILDFDQEGLLETCATLDKLGIPHVGAGPDRERAQKPVILEKKGFKIGVIGCADYPHEWEAAAARGGINYIDLHAPQAVCNRIRELKQVVDIVICTIHWGPNWLDDPLPEMVSCAHALVDAGADIIHGTSAHVVLGVERYRSGIIIYGAGDCVDDYAVDPAQRNDLSCLWELVWSHEGLRTMRLIPIHIADCRVQGIQDTVLARMVRERVRLLSERRGTDAHFFEEARKTERS